jgi:salicylate hydroxylase
VHYPVAAGTRLNVVVIARGGTSAAPPSAPFGREARTLIEAVEAWAVSELAEVDAVRPWTRGPVVLIGDAAHAMAPSAAQGGAQAIEDAWVLGESLAASSDPATALALYERARRTRVERVAREARRNLLIYELAGIPAAARNAMLRALPPNLLLSRLDWLFDWQPPQKKP